MIKSTATSYAFFNLLAIWAMYLTETDEVSSIQQLPTPKEETASFDQLISSAILFLISALRASEVSTTNFLQNQCFFQT